jgi:uncharacterized protein YggE
VDDLPLVSVRGEAVVYAEPEVATLDVAVASRDRDKDRTLARLDERSAAVQALLASFGDAVERVETAAVRIGPELKDGRGHERIAGYAGVVRHTVSVVGFDRLGDLVARLAEEELVDVAGPWWRLRPGSTVYRDARVAAARDAVTRATEYAAAVGSTVVSLVELADVGLLADAVSGAGGSGFAVAPMAAAAPGAARGFAGGGGGAAPVTFDVDPVRQVVRANVEARFRISAPASLA